MNIAPTGGPEVWPHRNAPLQSFFAAGKGERARDEGAAFLGRGQPQRCGIAQRRRPIGLESKTGER